MIKSQLQPLSDEQTVIINTLKYFNVIVDAVAGSGKTTTCLHIAKEFPSSKILLLTFNARLKDETRQKVIDYKIDNLEIHSYHSFCVKYYDRSAYNDIALNNVVKNKPPKLQEYNYDMILLDEAQDITPEFFRFILMILDNHNCSPNVLPKLCVLGDRFQSIYQFKNANSKFLTLADKIFPSNNKWRHLSLSTSFRLTAETANFVNKILKYDRIKTIKHGAKPNYIIVNTFNAELLYNYIKPFLKKHKPSDIFILAPSIKSERQTPLRKLENIIKEKSPKIPIYAPISDEEKVDNSIIEDKLVISTFHQTKGLERKIVFLLGIDSSYAVGKRMSTMPNNCSNDIYVALTRPTEQLIIFHEANNHYLPFITPTTIQQTNLLEMSVYLPKKIRPPSSKIQTCPTKLCRCLPLDVMEEALTYFQIKHIKPVNDIISIPTTTQFDTVENVSEINGTAIPIYYEYLQTDQISILDTLTDNENITRYNPTQPVKTPLFTISQLKQHITNKTLSIEHILYIATRWLAYSNGYVFKLKQIKHYNWMTNTQLTKAIDNLKELNISINAKFETLLEAKEQPELNNNELTGYMDCIDDSTNIIYEFKCVDEFTPSHYLQLAIYAYMNNLQNNNIQFNYRLFNIKTGELNELITTQDNLKKMMTLLTSFSLDDLITEEEFIYKYNSASND